MMAKPTAREISVVFVRQYYTLLNESPEQMHRFYSHDSSYVHGDIENGPLCVNKPARGQKEINERISEIHFKDARTKIHQVDAFPTLANGVVIQVSGLMSNNARPMRPFMQTFVLAPQTDKSYYVYNDIFRYQDEMFADDCCDTVAESYDEMDGGAVDENEAEVESSEPLPHSTTAPTPVVNNNNAKNVNPNINKESGSMMASTQQHAQINGHRQSVCKDVVSDSSDCGAGVASMSTNNNNNTTLTHDNNNINNSNSADGKLNNSDDTAMSHSVVCTPPRAQPPPQQQAAADTSTTAATADPTPSSVDVASVAPAPGGQMDKLPEEEVNSQESTAASRPQQQAPVPVSNEPKTYANLLKIHSSQYRRSLPANVSTARVSSEYKESGSASYLDSSSGAGNYANTAHYNNVDAQPVTASGGGGGSSSSARTDLTVPPSGGGGGGNNNPGFGDNSNSNGVGGDMERHIPREIFVGNLPEEISVDELIQHFRSYGSVVDARIMPSKVVFCEGGKRDLPPCGFVTFENNDIVDKILSLPSQSFHMERNGVSHRLNVMRKRLGGGSSGGGYSRSGGRGGMHRGRGAGGGAYSRGGGGPHRVNRGGGGGIRR